MVWGGVPYRCIELAQCVGRVELAKPIGVNLKKVAEFSLVGGVSNPDFVRI